MSRFTYENVTRRGQTGMKVMLDGRTVGQIRKVEGGFQYWPQNKKKFADPADIFPTVREVMERIEG